MMQKSKQSLKSSNKDPFPPANQELYGFQEENRDLPEGMDSDEDDSISRADNLNGT